MNWKYILIFVILAAIVGGGILAYQYWWLPKQEIKLSEEAVPEGEVPEEVIAPPELNLKTTKLATIPEDYSVFLSYDLPPVFGSYGNIIFSPDGKKVVYFAGKLKGKRFEHSLFLNDEEIISYEGGILDLILSPDGNKLAYIAREKSKGPEFVVVNGQKSKNYDRIWYITFSPDNRNLAYFAEKRRILGITKYPAKKVVINDREGKEYYWVSDLVFSPDSKQLVYAAKITPLKGETLEGDWIIVINGKESENSFDMISDITFSPDGQKLAYIATKEHKQFVVVNNQRSDKNYYEIKKLTFGPDSKQLAYAGRKSLYEAEWIVVINNKELENSYMRIHDIIFSPDNKKLAYIARSDTGTFLVVADVQEERKIQEERIDDYYKFSDLTFSPDGKQIAYRAEGDVFEVFIGVNGRKGKVYEFVSPPIFSPDSKQIAYGVLKNGVLKSLKNNELWWIVEEVE